MCKEKGFNFFFNTKNNGTLPLDPACPKSLSFWSPACLPYDIFSFIMKNKVERKKKIENLKLDEVQSNCV
jgi:hypothetical protein